MADTEPNITENTDEMPVMPGAEDAPEIGPDGEIIDVSPIVEDVEKPQSLIEIDEELQEQAADLLQQSTQIFDPMIWFQIGVLLIILGIAQRISRQFVAALKARIEDMDFKTSRKFSVHVIRRLPRLVLPGVTTVFAYFATKIAVVNGFDAEILRIATSLSFTVFAVTFAVSFIQSRFVSRLVANLAVIIAALHIFGVWEGTITTLENIRFGLSKNPISLLTLVKGLMYFAIFLWLARILSSLSEKQIKSLDELTPSLKVLFSKLLKIFIIFVAVLFGLNAIGVDLTSFAIFGGAIGVGLGFGLQKVVSNFISGIILLLDRSIKPGDVIAVDGPNGQTFGWVNTLGARYVSIIRRDGKEHLIPNEVLITERVENWSFSNNDVRLHIAVGVSYNSDVYRARELCLEAVNEEPRVKEFPKPLCHVTGFGDNSVDLEIRGWINDPVNGIGNVKSAVLLRVWDKFQEEGIEIPFPQRDLHIRSVDKDMVARLREDIRADIMKEIGNMAPRKPRAPRKTKRKSDE